MIMSDFEYATNDPDDGLEEVNISGKGQSFDDPVTIPCFPVTFRPKENIPFVATFCRLEKGQDIGYGEPAIAVFKNFEQGVGVDKEGKPYFPDPEQDYSFWLIHSTALNGLKDLKPKSGEKVAGVYLGKKTRKNPTPQQIKAGNLSYHAYRFWCPDLRPGVLDWDTIS